MDQLIPYTCHVFPGNLGVAAAKGPRNLFNRLSHDFQGADHRKNGLIISGELFKILNSSILLAESQMSCK